MKINRVKIGSVIAATLVAAAAFAFMGCGESPWTPPSPGGRPGAEPPPVGWPDPDLVLPFDPGPQNPDAVWTMVDCEVIQGLTVGVIEVTTPMDPQALGQWLEIAGAANGSTHIVKDPERLVDDGVIIRRIKAGSDYHVIDIRTTIAVDGESHIVNFEPDTDHVITVWGHGTPGVEARFTQASNPWGRWAGGSTIAEANGMFMLRRLFTWAELNTPGQNRIRIQVGDDDSSTFEIFNISVVPFTGEDEDEDEDTIAWREVIDSPLIGARGATLTATADGIVVSERGTGVYDHNNGIRIDVAMLRYLAGGTPAIVIEGTATAGITQMTFQFAAEGNASGGTVTDGEFTVTIPYALDATEAPSWAGGGLPFLGTDEGQRGNYTVTSITVGGRCIKELLEYIYVPTVPEDDTSVTYVVPTTTETYAFYLDLNEFLDAPAIGVGRPRIVTAAGYVRYTVADDGIFTLAIPLAVAQRTALQTATQISIEIDGELPSNSGRILLGNATLGSEWNATNTTGIGLWGTLSGHASGNFPLTANMGRTYHLIIQVQGASAHAHAIMVINSILISYTPPLCAGDCDPCECDDACDCDLVYDWPTADGAPTPTNPDWTAVTVVATANPAAIETIVNGSRLISGRTADWHGIGINAQVGDEVIVVGRVSQAWPADGAMRLQNSGGNWQVHLEEDVEPSTTFTLRHTITAEIQGGDGLRITTNSSNTSSFMVDHIVITRPPAADCGCDGCDNATCECSVCDTTECGCEQLGQNWSLVLPFFAPQWGLPAGNIVATDNGIAVTQRGGNENDTLMINILELRQLVTPDLAVGENGSLVRITVEFPQGTTTLGRGATPGIGDITVTGTSHTFIVNRNEATGHQQGTDGGMWIRLRPVPEADATFTITNIEVSTSGAWADHDDLSLVSVFDLL